jgi:hypothetical protein
MRPNPYGALGNEDRNTNIPHAQYTTAAMTWRSGYYEPQSPSEQQSVPARRTPADSVSQSSPQYTQYGGRNPAN